MTLGGILVPVPPLVEVTVALEPVDSTLMSLAALREPAEYGGMDEWAVNTAAQLPTTLRERHNFWMKWLWMDTLANAVERTAAINSFPAYLDALAAEDATVLRDRLLHWLIHSVHVRLYAGTATTPATLRADPAQLLRDGDHFAQWLLDRFTEKPLAAELADLRARTYPDPPAASWQRHDRHACLADLIDFTDHVNDQDRAGLEHDRPDPALAQRQTGPGSGCTDH